MEERLTICNESLEPVGTATRAQAHKKGLLHQVAHVWVVSRLRDGVWLWFQQRAVTKADFPGYYDIAVGGHISAGEGPLETALREMQEEIGLAAAADQLFYLGEQFDRYDLPGFHDYEIARVYCLTDASPVFHIGEEVDRMVRVSLKELLRKELFGAPLLDAFTDEGKRLVIPASQFCRHPGELRRLVLPWLESQGFS